MAFFLFSASNPYSSASTFCCQLSNYVFTTFDSISNYGSIIPNSSYLNLQSQYLNSSWFSPQANIIENRLQFQQQSLRKQTEKGKNSSSQKNFRTKNHEKQLESAKKNSQSNLVNQFLSYFSSFNNSNLMIMKALLKMNLSIHKLDKQQIQYIIVFFCKQISIVNSRKQRKYVNKTFLLNFFNIEKLKNYMPDILQKVDAFGFISRQQFCQLFRRVCYNFFRTISISSVTSSAKLNPISRPQHIKRRRLIVQTLAKK